MTEITIAVAAFSAAAYLFSKGLLSEGGKDAYLALKRYFRRHVEASDLDKLAEQPDSQARQDVLVEDLTRAIPSADAELSRMVAALRAEIARADTQGAAAAVFESVKARGHIINERLTARGPGARAAVYKDVEVGGSIVNKDLDTGMDREGNP